MKSCWNCSLVMVIFGSSGAVATCCDDASSSAACSAMNAVVVALARRTFLALQAWRFSRKSSRLALMAGMTWVFHQWRVGFGGDQLIDDPA